MIHEIQKQMVLQSPLLMEKVKVYRNSIVAKDGSFIQARSADADTAHGYNAHAVLFDELHSQPKPRALRCNEDSERSEKAAALL